MAANFPLLFRRTRCASRMLVSSWLSQWRRVCVAKIKSGSEFSSPTTGPPADGLLQTARKRVQAMLIFAETRIKSSNAEGLSQFEHLARRDRKECLWNAPKTRGC